MASPGKPGPALTVGIPLIVLGAAGYFGYNQFVKPAIETKDAEVTQKKLEASTASSGVGAKHANMIRVAGDPWSGYSTFRNEPKLTKALAKQDIGIEYIDDEALYDQNNRMEALATGKIDLALTTVDAFLQHGGKHKQSGLYPGVIVWNIDESNGGDAIFLAKGRTNFDDVQPTDKVCYAEGTPSEHLWDFASLSFAQLGDAVGTDNGVVAKDCWDKLQSGAVQIAVLWQPFTALAEKAGYTKVFATGGQADDVIVDIVVANRDFVIKEKDTLGKLAQAYFTTMSGYDRDAAGHGAFITADCGPDCGGDSAMGNVVLEGIDFLTYDENMCLWWGQCGSPMKMTSRIRKTGRLLAAKGKVSQSDLPDPTTILNDSFLLQIKKQRLSQAKLAAEVAGKDTKIEANVVKQVEEKRYEYGASETKDDATKEVGTLNLPNIYFAKGKHQLDQNAESVVSSISDKLRDFPALCVKVHGHTSSVGKAASNQKLSERRAHSIVNHLKSIDGLAFPASRFDVRGFGSQQKIMRDGKEDTDASRRTEFKLFNCDS